VTLGFARRFAGYKRPELLFHDPDASRDLNAAGRRAGDFRGKAIRPTRSQAPSAARIQTCARSALPGVAFIDDYDLHVAHFLVQGCDVWLNNREAARASARAA